MTEDGAARVCRHLRITGRVQGVWYRGWTVQRATALGLDGWVRNRADGSVEALVAGPAPAVRDLIAACRDGPPNARVTAVIDRPAAERDLVDPGPVGFQQWGTV